MSPCPKEGSAAQHPIPMGCSGQHIGTDSSPQGELGWIELFFQEMCIGKINVSAYFSSVILSQHE